MVRASDIHSVATKFCYAALVGTVEVVFLVSRELLA